jgi:DNA-binding NarL/FixJ family response regulator
LEYGSARLRILLVDDHELVRRGLVSILNAGHPEWEIAGEAGSGAAALDLGLRLKPDVAILDLSLPDLTGLQVAEQLIGAVPGIRILVLTMHAAEPILRRLQKAGVSAYLAKNEAPRQLIRAVERILAGEPFFASAEAYRPSAELSAAEYVPVQFLLTARELDVMRLLVQNRSNKQVASDLGLSVRTVEQHHASILAKLGVDSPGEMVKIAIRDRAI